MDDGFWNSVPNFLRWLLFLPVALLAMGAVYTLVFVGNQISGMDQLIAGTSLGRLIITAMASGASAYAFIWAGGTVVPKHKFTIAVSLTVIYGLLAGMLVTGNVVWSSQPSVSGAEVFGTVIVGCIAAIVSCSSFRDNHKKTAGGT